MAVGVTVGAGVADAVGVHEAVAAGLIAGVSVAGVAVIVSMLPASVGLATTAASRVGVIPNAGAGLGVDEAIADVTGAMVPVKIA
jgi:hypothetical protein